LGVAQHHDAVSGTEKQEVVFDYAQRLSDGIDTAVVSLEKNKTFEIDMKNFRMLSIMLTVNCYQKILKCH
jgi:hypothetical protein